MPSKTVSLDQIQEILPSLDLVPMIERGFAAYSAGESVVPPVGELILDGGEVHIKYGFIQHQAYYVIKIASGFYGNPGLGLPSSNGVMLLFSQQTGELVSILLDEGHLTDVRTAVAGAVAAKHLAPQHVEPLASWERESKLACSPGTWRASRLVATCWYGVAARSSSPDTVPMWPSLALARRGHSKLPRFCSTAISS